MSSHGCPFHVSFWFIYCIYILNKKSPSNLDYLRLSGEESVGSDEERSVLGIN
jgi:hypothetical protein